MTPDPTAPPEPEFVSRHIGPGEDDVAAMLKVVGQPSVAALLDTALPRHHPVRSGARHRRGAERGGRDR